MLEAIMIQTLQLGSVQKGSIFSSHLLEKMEPLHLSILRLETLTLTRNMVIEVMLPIGLVIETVWIIFAKVGQFRIISTFRGGSPLILKVMGPEDLIIKTDRHMTI
jgi:hypothetical protein